MKRLLSLLILTLLVATTPMPAAWAQGASQAPTAPVSGQDQQGAAAPGSAVEAERARQQPMDPRVSTALTVVTGAAVLTLGVVALPWLAEVMSIGSYSVLCTVAPVC